MSFSPELLVDILSKTIEEGDCIVSANRIYTMSCDVLPRTNAIAEINAYIEKYESILFTFGCWVKGIRVRGEGRGFALHETPEGVAAILSLNMTVLRQKAVTTN